MAASADQPSKALVTVRESVRRGRQVRNEDSYRIWYLVENWALLDGRSGKTQSVWCVDLYPPHSEVLTYLNRVPEDSIDSRWQYLYTLVSLHFGGNRPFTQFNDRGLFISFVRSDPYIDSTYVGHVRDLLEALRQAIPELSAGSSLWPSMEQDEKIVYEPTSDDEGDTGGSESEDSEDDEDDSND